MHVIHQERAGGMAMNKYNCALGDFLKLPARLDQDYHNVVSQIYPLRADIEKLQEFCNQYVNLEGAPVRFKPVAPWVLITDVFPGDADTQERQPVKNLPLIRVYSMPQKPPGGHPVPALPTGITAVPAQATAPPSVTSAVSVHAALPATSAPATSGQPDMPNQLELYGLTPYLTKLTKARSAVGSELDLGRRSEAEGGIVTQLGAWLPDISSDGFYAIALKQVRDAKLTDKAVYQSLVGVRRWFANYAETRLPEIEVVIYRYWSMPIVEKMNLITEKADHEKYVLRPLVSFGISGIMHEKIGRNLCWRIGEDTKWTSPLPPFDPFKKASLMEPY